MKKLTQLLGLTAILSLMVLIGSGKVYARLTGTNPSSADVWCVGPSGAEVCVDASGNVVPTTASDTTLGTSALPFASSFVDTETINTAINLPNNSIQTAKLVAGAVNTEKLADAAVTTDKLAGGAVITAKLLGGSVTDSALLANAVVTSKLSADSVVTAKILDGAVSANKLQESSVTTTKILAGVIGSGKIMMGGPWAKGALCFLDSSNGAMGHCTASDASVCTCQ